MSGTPSQASPHSPHRAQREQMDHQVSLVLVDKVDPRVPTDRLAHGVPQDRRDKEVLLVLLALRARRETKARLATGATLETGGHLDPLETLATMALRDLLDNEARRLVRNSCTGLLCVTVYG